MNAFLVLCLLLRAVSPAFVESTDALFADFHVDAALIGRLWKPFLALDPVDRTAFAAHQELVTAPLRRELRCRSPLLRAVLQDGSEHHRCSSGGARDAALPSLRRPRQPLAAL